MPAYTNGGGKAVRHSAVVFGDTEHAKSALLRPGPTPSTMSIAGEAAYTQPTPPPPPPASLKRRLPLRNVDMGMTLEAQVPSAFQGGASNSLLERGVTEMPLEPRPRVLAALQSTAAMTGAKPALTSKPPSAIDAGAPAATGHGGTVGELALSFPNLLVRGGMSSDVEVDAAECSRAMKKGESSVQDPSREQPKTKKPPNKYFVRHAVARIVQRPLEDPAGMCARRNMTAA